VRITGYAGYDGRGQAGERWRATIQEVFAGMPEYGDPADPKWQHWGGPGRVGLPKASVGSKGFTLFPDQTLEFDPVACRIINVDEANQAVAPEYRTGWSL